MPNTVLDAMTDKTDTAVPTSRQSPRAAESSGNSDDCSDAVGETRIDPLVAEIRRTLDDSPYPLQTITLCNLEGQITFRGTVETWHHKQMAQELARGVPGVIQIVNGIQVVTNHKMAPCDD